MRGRAIAIIVLGVMTLGAAGLLAGCGFFPNASSITSPSQPPGSSTTLSTVVPSTTSSTTPRATTTTAAPSTSSTTTEPPTTEPPTTTGTTTAGKPAREYVRIPTEEKVIALTFDAAYDPAPLADILSALEEADAAATFFLTGEFVRDFPQETKRIIAGGYPIGNHSYSHPYFTRISDAKIKDELRRTAAAITKVGGEDPRPLFRPPYGDRNKHVLSVIGAEGYVSVYWTIDTIDWKPERTPAQIKATVLDKLEPGAIVLMHVGSYQTAKVLPELLAELKQRGYRFVDLREALS